MTRVRGHRQGRFGAVIPLVLGVMLIGLADRPAPAQQPQWRRTPVSLRLGPGIQGFAVNAPESLSVTASVTTADPMERFERPVPIGGWVPRVAIGLTDARISGEFSWAHAMSDTVVGTPLTGSLETGYTLGVVDTGATIDLISECARTELGLSFDFMTFNQIEIGGAGGNVLADVSNRIGFFLDGLQAINPATRVLNTARMSGHFNVSVVVLPDAACGDGVDVPSVVGTPFLAFRDFAIRNDRPQSLTIGGTTVTSPQVEFFPQNDPGMPSYATRIPMLLLPDGIPLETASFYPELFTDDFGIPWIPTALVAFEGTIPSGGAYFASTRVFNEGGETGNDLFLVDTGAQVTVIRTFIAGRLRLNLAEPEFTVDVLGASGEVQAFPGFVVDTLEIDTISGGPIVYNEVPVLVLDIPSVAGGTLSGILGTNLFIGRNLAFKTDSPNGPVLEVSGLVVPVCSDLDGNAFADDGDLVLFESCLTGPGLAPTSEDCFLADMDQDNDVDLDDFSLWMQCNDR